MTNESRIHVAIHFPRTTLNSTLEKWLHEMIATAVAIPEIGKIIVRRLPRHENDIEPDEVLNQMSPWVVGWPRIPVHPKGVVEDRLGWWWNLSLHFAFKTEPYPDYVLHWPFDMEWQPGDGNTVASRDKIRGFLESVEGYDLIIGSFVTSTDKDLIEDGVKDKLRESFPQFDYSRPRSEFFIISRDLFYEFNRDVSPEEFCDDFSAQLLVYAHLRNKHIHEWSLGTYLVNPEEYTQEKVQKQLERIQDVVTWGKTKEMMTDAA